MSWHYLQEQEEAHWQHDCLDGAPFALLSLMPEQGIYCSTGSATECLIDSPCGTTYAHLTVGSGADTLTLLREDSHARILASAERAQELTESEADYGKKWQGSFAKYDRDTHSLKTAQCSLIEDLNECLQTWPEWGCMLDGECFALPVLERAIIERGFSWLLTPTAQSWKAWTFRNPLALIRKNHADGNLQEQLMRLYQRMITPRCQEILMMWPEGWTDSKPLEMDGFRQWLAEHGGF